MVGKGKKGAPSSVRGQKSKSKRTLKSRGLRKCVLCGDIIHENIAYHYCPHGTPCHYLMTDFAGNIVTPPEKFVPYSPVTFLGKVADWETIHCMQCNNTKAR